MRVLQLISSLEKGGAERYCIDVCNELSKRPGIEVLLVSMSSANEYEFLTKNLNYKICNSYVFPSISGKSKININEFDDIVQAFKPDIIHSHLFWAELLAHEKYYPSVKYVTHCQDNMIELNNFSLSNIFKKKTYTRLFEKKWMIKKYRTCKNNFLVISKDCETYYKRVLPKDLQRIQLLYHAIDFNRFNKANHQRIDLLNKIRLVYTARFAIYKNHSFLVDIVEVLKNRGYDVELEMLGHGEHFESVVEKTKSKKLEKYIHFRGIIDNVETYLEKSNLYIHPAYYEPFGLVIVEAMAAGLPVICLDGKGNRDLIEQDKNGYMFYEQNANLFADKIVEYLSSNEKYQTLSDYAVKYARDFDIVNHVDKLLKYYQTL